MTNKLEWKRLDLNPPKWNSDSTALVSETVFLRIKDVINDITVATIFHHWDSGIEITYGNWCDNDHLHLSEQDFKASDVLWCEIPQEIKDLFKIEEIEE